MKVDVAERAQKARELFAQGYNCAQSVVLAYSDVMDVDAKTLATMSAPFGGGMGRLREVCGAVSGMFMIAGSLVPAFDPAQKAAKAANYALVQNLAEEFRKENRSIICRELLGLVPFKDGVSSAAGASASGVSGAAAVPYKKRPCAELVEMAAAIVARKINETPSL